jgi:hypothetical protein
MFVKPQLISCAACRVLERYPSNAKLLSSLDQASRILCTPPVNQLQLHMHLQLQLIGCAACRVLERYPSNAKLLKAYAKFLEEVQHDPWRANRYYRCGILGCLHFVAGLCLADKHSCKPLCRVYI